ncbi:hypothetical protein HCN44_003427 [Aphidius gifuensis]|uniref:Uncharacterized protein n=1 Tax=Aphidius gifuensis TaxID=684658 RepID=A0A834XLI8_APHGI|nr:hypothetical protein HCN44_003427 [Aphidius gifuensis]
MRGLFQRTDPPWSEDEKDNDWTKRIVDQEQFLEVLANHEVVRRNSNGEEQKNVGQELKNTNAEEYKEKLINDNVQYGEDIPPYIRSNTVYRQENSSLIKLRVA